MPLYEYKCETCSRVFEVYKRLADDTSASPCPVCGEKADKVGVSLVSARTGGAGSPGGSATCGGGSRRSPFS